MGEQRVALVTGGAKRVGRAIVERLTQEGFSVAFTYNSSAENANVLRGTSPATLFSIRADLSDPAAGSDTIAREFRSQFDRLDLLVNNASIYRPATLEDADLNLARLMMAIHYESPLLLVQKFAGLLRSSKGHVVNMVDLMAQKPMPQYIPYCASKAALVNLTLSLARALAPEVTVNGIAPGVVAWPTDFPGREKEQYLKRVPLARAGSPEDVAELVWFLATSGSYITGQILNLDGGRSIM